MGKRRPLPTPTPTSSQLIGTDGNDTLIWGILGAGSIDGRSGVDTLSIRLGSATSDIIMSGAVGDGTTARLSTGLVFSNIEGLQISTGSGNDRLFGGTGNDFFSAGTGNDTVNGGGGADWFDLAQGDNIATGGGGADTFFLLNDGRVTITDFAIAEGDKIFLDVNGVDVPTAWGLENGFIRFRDSAAGAVIDVDFDGSGAGFQWSEVAVLQGIAVASVTPEFFVI